MDQFLEKLLHYFTTSAFIVSVGTVVAAFILSVLLKKLITKGRQKLASGDEKVRSRKETYLGLVSYAAQIILFAVAGIIVLEAHGVNVTSLVAGFGIAGVVVGLALQDALKDYIMGYNILANEFFLVGDVVNYNGTVGEVLSYTMRYTKLRVLDNNSILTICNRNISEITRLSDLLVMTVPTSYDDDPDRIEQALRELSDEIAQIPGVTSCELAGLQSFDDSSIGYLLLAHASPLIHGKVKRAARGILRRGFIARHISIPYPQLDIHSC